MGVCGAREGEQGDSDDGGRQCRPSALPKTPVEKRFEIRRSLGGPRFRSRTELFFFFFFFAKFFPGAPRALLPHSHHRGPFALQIPPTEPKTVVRTKRGRPPVNVLIRRDGRGSLTLDLWLPPPPPQQQQQLPQEGNSAAATAAAASKAAAAAETPSGEVPSIAPGASPEQRRLWFADLLFNRERAFFARLASEAAAAIESSAPAWQVPVAALLRHLNQLEEREKEQQREQLRQQFGGVGVSGGGPPSSRSPGFGGGGGSSAGTASSVATLGLGPFAWPKELCSSESNAASEAAAKARAAAADAADDADTDPTDAGASSPPPSPGPCGEEEAAAAKKSGEETSKTTTSMALLLRAECLSHIPHMRVVSAHIGGERFLGGKVFFFFWGGVVFSSSLLFLSVEEITHLFFFPLLSPPTSKNKKEATSLGRRPRSRPPWRPPSPPRARARQATPPPPPPPPSPRPSSPARSSSAARAIPSTWRATSATSATTAGGGARWPFTRRLPPTSLDTSEPAPATRAVLTRLAPLSRTCSTRDCLHRVGRRTCRAGSASFCGGARGCLRCWARRSLGSQ